jgi:hypothetical protein
MIVWLLFSQQTNLKETTCTGNNFNFKNKIAEKSTNNLVGKRTIPTEQPLLVGEVSVNYLFLPVKDWQNGFHCKTAAMLN